MTFNPEIHHRRSIRWRGHDYSRTGIYFITLCTADRECLLGKIELGKIALSGIGEIIRKEWETIEQRFPRVVLHESIVMPNHLHGIIEILPEGMDNPNLPNRHNLVLDEGNQNERLNEPNMKSRDRGLMNQTPTIEPKNNWILMKQTGLTLGKIIRFFKAKTTRLVRDTFEIGNLWQRNYYDHVIRNLTELDRYRSYVHENPHKWAEDEENPRTKTAGV